ncbi:MAG: PAS domain S-box protein [Elainellaceae cyanobacterium]
MLTQFTRTVDSLWFRLPIRRQITILITLPMLCLAIALLSLDRIRQHAITEPSASSSQSPPLEQHWNTVTFALGATASISLVSVVGALYWVKRLHQELRDRNVSLVKTLLLQQAVDASIPDALMVLSLDGHITAINQAAVRMFGYEPEEIIGSDFNRLLADANLDPEAIAPSSLTTASKATSNTLSKPQPSLPVPQQALGCPRIGRRFPVALWIKYAPPIRAHCLVVRDITEQEQIKTDLLMKISELAYASAELEQARVELRDMYLACHDLKSPMQAIAHLSEWIEGDLSDRVKGETQDQMHLLRQRVHRMEGLVNALLDAPQHQDHSQES